MAVVDSEPAAKATAAPPSERAAAAAPANRRWKDRLKAAPRKVVSVVLCLLALLVAGQIFGALSSFKTEPGRRAIRAEAYNVRTFTVQPRTYREVVSGFGTARADRQVSVAAEVAGRVLSVHPNLEIGTEVDGPDVERTAEGETGSDQGEVLVTIDPATYQQRVEQLQRGLDSDDVELKQLVTEELNTRRLIEQQKKTVETSQQELDSKRRLADSRAGNSTQLRQAQLSLQQAEDALVRLQNELNLFTVREEAVRTRKAGREAELETARLDVQRASVRAPFDGQLSEVAVELGQYVRPGDMLVQVTDLDHIEVPVALSQAQFERVEPLLLAGEQPQVGLADNETAEPRWSGRLVRAAPVANTDTRTVDVFVEVDNSEQSQPLLPGTFVHARIDGPLLEDALLVPRDAIVRDGVFVVSELTDQARAAIARGGSAVGGTADDADDADAVEEASAVETELPEDAQLAVTREVDVTRTLQTFAVLSGEGAIAAGDEVIMTNLDRLVDGKSLVRPQDSLTIEEEIARQRTEVLRLVED